MKPWSKKYSCCKNCSTTEVPHIARGLCKNCYNKFIESTNPRGFGKKGSASAKITRENLLNMYWEQNFSLSDIAKQIGCTRQFVMKKIREYGIALRTKGEARNLALEKEKLVFIRNEDDGSKRVVKLNKINVDKDFFKTWTPQMAWVLGLIFTDGNIHIRENLKTGYKIKRFSLAQNNPEILIKTLKLLQSNSKIYKSNNSLDNKPRFIYSFTINNQEMCDDLIRLGVVPKKSLTAKFPTAPENCLRHFIRGCWDGDGSISELKQNNFRASFVSASYDFMFRMIMELKKAGFENLGIYKNESINTIYNIYFSSTADCAKLFEYMYSGIDSSIYYERKY